MSDEASPRPWRVSVRSGQILDADGFAVTPIDGADMSDSNMALIVDAVNGIEETKKLSIRLYDPIKRAEAERDGLRKQVGAYLTELVKRSSINESLGKALKRICEICSEAWDAPERDREAAMSKALNDIYELARGSRKEAEK